jgi:nucleoside-diphosphate-sugar epimerase
MRILITGTTGFLGKIIKNELIKNELYDLNRLTGSYHVDLGEKIPYFDNQFELVIHVAGLAHKVPKSDDKFEKFYKVNVTGTSNLLKGLEQSGISSKLLFISTVAVYGLNNGLLINEESKPRALDPYGLSKIKAEKLVLDWCKKYNVICTILRIPLLAGQNPPGNLGAMIKGIQKGYYFNIAGGKAKKSMVLAEDVAKSILKVAEIGGVYNLTDGYHPTFEELSNHISRQLGMGRPKNLPLWAARLFAKFGDYLGTKAPLNSYKLNKIISDLTFDDSKARTAFGWNPTPVLKGFRIN